MNLLLALLAATACFLALRQINTTRQLVALERALATPHELALPEHRGFDGLSEIAAAVNRREGEWRERLSAEHRQREVFLQIMNGLGEGILAIDRDRRIVLANQSISALLGVDSPPAGSLLVEVMRVSTVFNVFDRALDGHESSGRFSVRWGVAERKIEMRAFPLASQRIAAVALFIDVTQLERLEQIRRNFMSDFSHEVRTPLAGLRSAVESYDAVALTEEEDKQLRRIMVRQLLRLERLVDDLSELSRIESGDLSLSYAAVHLRRVIEDLCEDFAERAAQQQVRFTIHGDEIVVCADVLRIQQAFSNLIDNALKYGGAGQVIDIEIINRPSVAVVRFSDQGEGIPEDERERIFRRFHRIDKSRSQVTGTGLGLAITKHIVLLHKGTIDVESQIGRGSTFVVTLPMTRSEGPTRFGVENGGILN